MLSANGTIVSDSAESFYHNENPKHWRRQRGNKSKVEVMVIAWDGEGISSRPSRPQDYVLFGCSAEPDSPLIVEKPGQTISHKEAFKYICDVGSRNPGAIHIGYSFKYDQNMLIRTMSLKAKERLKNGEWVRWEHNGDTYKLKIIWGKRTHVVREGRLSRVSVRIDDIFPSFHSSFVVAYEKYFTHRDSNWNAVKEGKQLRSDRDWSELPSIQFYWKCEINALAQLGTLYRDLLYGGGFEITDFYGPGPIASYLRKRSKLAECEWGAKEANLPEGVHAASKSAFYGGRFEQFLVGRIEGPVYSLDINSAYPYALCQIPRLAAEGFWQKVYRPSNNEQTFGVYHVRYRWNEYVNSRGAPRRCDAAQPLPYRDKNGIISYPAITQGWYWRPEIQAVLDLYPDRIEILDGWEWIGENSYPWHSLMETMFAQRKMLKQQGSPLELVYKLAINSLYGKYAQRVGWNRVMKVPPSSHALPIAGFVTSVCRAMIMRVLSQIPVDQLIAVETDGIYTTVNPALLVLPTGIGDNLGQWEVESFDEALYVQNGVYCMRRGDKWIKAKSRGFASTLVSPDVMANYLQSLEPYTSWPVLQISKDVQNFVGIGSALQWAKGSPARAQILHCQWIKQTRELIPGGKGKRTHVPAECRTCAAGDTAYERPHFLFSNHGAFGGLTRIIEGKEAPEWDYHSKPHILPWESDSDYNWRLQQELENERIEFDCTSVPNLLP